MIFFTSLYSASLHPAIPCMNDRNVKEVPSMIPYLVYRFPPTIHLSKSRARKSRSHGKQNTYTRYRMIAPTQKPFVNWKK